MLGFQRWKIERWCFQGGGIAKDAKNGKGVWNCKGTVGATKKRASFISRPKIRLCEQV